MAANLITYADGVVSPFLDGIMQELYTSGGGVITGGTITISGASTLHITQTHGALCGREFSIDDGDYSVPLSSSGTKLGRIYLHMDLANTAVPLEVLVETGSTLTPVIQDDDVNETDGTYEINLATFEVDESTIKNLTNVAPAIKIMLERTLQTVADCALSTDPQDIAGAAVVSSLNSKIAQTDGVSVNLSSAKTLQTSLNELFALVDQTKIKYSSKFIYNYGGGSYSALSLMYVAANTYEFSQAETSSSGVRALVAYIRNTGSGMYQNIGTTYNDLTNTYGVNGRSFEIYY